MILRDSCYTYENWGWSRSNKTRILPMRSAARSRLRNFGHERTKHWVGRSWQRLRHSVLDGIVVKPAWGRLGEGEHAADVFVVMPFREDLKTFTRIKSRRWREDLNLTVKRADDVFSADAVMSVVWDGICGARAIVADCTDRNANVFYEIGLAYVVGKPVLFITQNSDDVPFDIAQFKYLRL